MSRECLSLRWSSVRARLSRASLPSMTKSEAEKVGISGVMTWAVGQA